MSEAKKRINLTVDDETYSTLKKLSVKKRQKISAFSMDLIQMALELHEDFYFSQEAARRLSQKFRRVSHSKAWDIS